MAMRRPRPQPKDTRLPRLRNAVPPERAEGVNPIHKTSERPTPRIKPGKNLRLRDVHRD
jgi:hypothetical protein